jgi:hydrophobic/amphiphilic exporter-1 (mainly G- bacteria), HAE1 family
MGRLNGKPAAVIAIYQLPGSNALDCANGVKKAMARIRQSFPQGLDYQVALDTTQAVSEGMREISNTLWQAMLLVILVVFVFLQGWRPTLIPLLAVPVSLDRHVHPVSGVRLLGQHALALRPGAGHRPRRRRRDRRRRGGRAPHRGGHGAPRRDDQGHGGGVRARRRDRDHPRRRLHTDGVHPGITGRLYQQFALTIAISVIISAFNALSLSPALCAMLLRPKDDERRAPWRGSTAWFNRMFGRVQTGLRGLLAPPDPQERAQLRRPGVLRRRRVSSSAGSCPPRSCPRRTRATSTSGSSCPTPPRSSARARPPGRSRRS